MDAFGTDGALHIPGRAKRRTLPLSLIAITVIVVLVFAVQALGVVGRTMGFFGSRCDSEDSAALQAEAASVRSALGSEKVSDVYCDDSGDGKPYVVISPPDAERVAAVVDVLAARGWKCEDIRYGAEEGISVCANEVDDHSFEMTLELMADETIDIGLSAID
ncbi:hypothetical protein [Myceligenerans pegani]|uniref:Uncharacterized protein n=1 Tax=Myceligenerans pegani TaxID=2776917 RepID=A0ABR9MX77_9MICO|nr:hypothetical protein [Myceligenerans sp. TRM 65318]MBE1875985.1 hypothetical protein [Myceligenerans sp. TRM 65318]MBE3018256.1 hypothetical protein [Myceligenerans sp. TRM 65318]